MKFYRKKPSVASVVQLGVRDDFGDILKDARRRRGITQEQLSDIMGVDRTYVCKIEREVKMPPMSIAIKLSHALKDNLFMEVYTNAVVTSLTW